MLYRSIITLANSIIGVSLLAMPFCFKQCGIVLAIIMLILSGAIVKITCRLLLKAAVLARRRNYELLAFQTFGSAGKLCVELCMIGFVMGTCTAFFVVIGDLAPPIIGNLFNVENSSNLRLVILVGLGVFVALPLALLKNVESLTGLCTASIGFYLIVLLHIVVASWPSLVSGAWVSSINYWRPAGIFQCLPIFCMALSCQPQVFEIYEGLSEPSLNNMDEVVRSAVNLCTGCYISVGIFGYIAFCTTAEFGGNILTAFPISLTTEVIKLGFVLSVAMSFPLVIFPCRSSIYSLLFKKGTLATEITSNYIPSECFNIITVGVILLTLTLGILIPDIEFVLGMVGSTIGSAVCVVFPSLMFIKLTSKNTPERLSAQVIFVIGICIMILGTYVNLNEANRGPEKPYLNPSDDQKVQKLDMPPPRLELRMDKLDLNEDQIQALDKGIAVEDNDARQEPVEPKPPKNEADDKRIPDLLPKVVANGDPMESENHVPANLPLDPGGDSKKTVEEREQVLADKEQKEQEQIARDKKTDELLKALEKQKVEQKQIIEEQKEILKQLKEKVNAEVNKSTTSLKNAVSGKTDDEKLSKEFNLGLKRDVKEDKKLKKDSDLETIGRSQQFENSSLKSWNLLNQHRKFSDADGLKARKNIPIGSRNIKIPNKPLNYSDNNKNEEHEKGNVAEVDAEIEVKKFLEEM